MAQKTIFSNITRAVTGTSIAVSPTSATMKVQFTPSSNGFTGTICLQFSLVPNTASGYLWYSIPTIGVDPWSEPLILVFNAHTNILAFDLYLGSGNRFVQFSIVEYSRGSISGYIAY
jgi:hypothetical protein